MITTRLIAPPPPSDLMPHYSRLLCVQPASRSLHLGSLLPQQQLFRAPNSLCPRCRGTLVYGAAANCFSSHPNVAAPSRQGKSCQPSFYLVPRVCALKEARSAPGGRRTKPQPPPPLPPSAVSLEGLKPGRGGRAVYGYSGSWEEITVLRRGGSLRMAGAVPALKG